MVEANGDPHRSGEQMDVAGFGTTERFSVKRIDYLFEEGNDDA
jgi:hypothetical protein